MTTEVPFNQQLTNIISSLFNKVYKGQSLGMQQIELLQGISKEFAEAIEKAAEHKALQKCKELQNAVAEGFRSCEADVTDTISKLLIESEKVSNLEEQVTTLKDELKVLQIEVKRVKATPPPREHDYLAGIRDQPSPERLQTTRPMSARPFAPRPQPISNEAKPDPVISNEVKSEPVVNADIEDE